MHLLFEILSNSVTLSANATMNPSSNTLSAPSSRPTPAPTAAPLALVTGSAKRLGRQVIEAFAQAGYDCLIHANQSREDAMALREQLQGYGVKAEVVLHAIADPQEAAHTLVQAAQDLFGRLPDASVLCAASYDFDTPLAPDPVLMQKQLALNFLFPVQYCAVLAQAANLAGEADRSVTVFTDYKVERVNRDFFSYSISKHALNGSLPYLTVAYARLLRINAIAPGPVLAAHGMTQDALNTLVAQESISGRHPNPQDIARTALFLATTTSMVGQHICVDAGARFDARTRELVVQD